MYKRKFISIKYTRHYSYAKFGTFFCATQYKAYKMMKVVLLHNGSVS